MDVPSTALQFVVERAWELATALWSRSRQSDVTWPHKVVQSLRSAHPELVTEQEAGALAAWLATVDLDGLSAFGAQPSARESFVTAEITNEVLRVSPGDVTALRAARARAVEITKLLPELVVSSVDNLTAAQLVIGHRTRDEVHDLLDVAGVLIEDHTTIFQEIADQRREVKALAQDVRSVLRAVDAQLREEERLPRAVLAFLSDQHRRDGVISLRQTETTADLLSAFVDLPLEGHGDAAAAFLATLTGPASVTLVGGPGQGKSTLLQFLAQLHRAAWLENDHDTKALVAAGFDGLLSAKARQVPLRVTLRELAAWLSRVSPDLAEDAPGSTLEDYLCSEIASKSGEAAFSPRELHQLLERLPVVLLLDGLDEVPNRALREATLQRVAAFEYRVRVFARRLTTIVSTRPVGELDSSYARALGDRRFGHFSLTLADIDETTVVEFARKWTRAHGLPEQERESVLATLLRTLEIPHVRELARNPCSS